MNNSANIIVSNTNISAFYELLKVVKEKSENILTKNIIVVPDRFSLNAEHLLFERNKIESTFNVEILTFTRLVNSVLSKKIRNFKFLNKQNGTMLLQKIILDAKSKLKCYGKLTNSYGFAENVFNTINLLKSSGVTANEIVLPTEQANKFEDIKLLYSEYEKCISDELVDGISRLQLFNSELITEKPFQNTVLYFGMFDSFTNEQLKTLELICKTSSSVYFAVCANTLQNNCAVYDNSVFNSLKQTLMNNGIPYEIKNHFATAKGDFDNLIKNLFALEPKLKEHNGEVKLFEAENIYSECNFICREIKKLILHKGLNFSDIAIAVNGLESYEIELQKDFEIFGIPAYFDTKNPLSNHFLTKFILDCIKCVLNDYSSVSMLNLAKNAILNYDDNEVNIFENVILRYGFNKKEFLSEFKILKPEEIEAENIRKQICEIIVNFNKEICNCKNISDFCMSIKNLLTSINAEEVIEKINIDEKDVVKVLINQQVIRKLLEIINECETMLNTTEADLNMFYQIIQSGFSATNLNSIPITTNSVFIGDASESMFYPGKVLFVLNCANGKMPGYKQDYGMITDKEIEKLKSKNKISPTIREINVREKFKLFNLCVLPEQHLYLSYPIILSGEVQMPSEFILSVQKIIGKNDKPLSVIKIEDQVLMATLNEKNLSEQLAEIIAYKQNAEKLAFSKSETNIAQVIKNIFDIKNEQINNKKMFINNAQKLFFPTDTTKISQLETFSNCPYKHFLTYGLKLKEKEKCEIRPLDNGNFLHEITKNFVDYLIKHNFECNNVENIVEECFNSLINNQKYFALKKNNISYRSLLLECKRLAKGIFSQISASSFKPIETECSFKNFQLEKNLSLRGVVDRIDTFGDYLWILDYKTGVEQFNYSSLFYGVKVQLLVYLKILSIMLNKKPVACTYFPIKNSFTKTNNGTGAEYKQSGVYINNLAIIKNLDKQLLVNSKSNIIPAEFLKSGELNSYSVKYALTNNEFDDVLDYAIDICKTIVNQINKGYIQPKPIGENEVTNSCKFCAYKNICFFDVETHGLRIKNSIEKNDYRRK